MLRGERAAALAAAQHVGAALRVEEDHSFRPHRAAFGGAKRERVDARLPGDLGKRDIHARERVADPRAIHMQRDAAFVRDVGQLSDLGDPVDRAAFGGLRERKYGRADMMRPTPGATFKRGAQRCGGNLGSVAFQLDELGAAAKKFRRATFIGRDVRSLVAQHRAPRGRQVRDGERIRHGAGRHQKYGDFLFENLGKAPLDSRRPVVIAVAERITHIRTGDRVEDFRRHSGGVVAREVHVSPRSAEAGECNSVALRQRSVILLLRAQNARSNKQQGRRRIWMACSCAWNRTSAY